jgi:hypothetical protein
MSLIDIKAVKAEAQSEFNKEAADKAKHRLKAQMRNVEAAKAVVRAEELKLADLEQQIADGTF